LVALYGVWPGNRLGLFLQPRGPHWPISCGCLNNALFPALWHKPMLPHIFVSTVLRWANLVLPRPAVDLHRAAHNEQ